MEIDGPAAQPVFQMQRRVVNTTTGIVREETVVGITRRPSCRATAQQVARSVRQHWPIEHRAHWVRDVTLGEDAGRVRTVPIPQVRAALRNTIIGLLQACGYRQITATRHDVQANPWEALALLGIHRDN